MRKAIIVCAGIALVTGMGCLIVWKILSVRSGQDKPQKGAYTMAAVTGGTDFGDTNQKSTPEQLPHDVPSETALASVDADKPAPVTAKPEDDQPIAVSAKPEEDQPAIVAAKPEEDQPAPVAAKPADDQPASVTSKPADDQPAAVTAKPEEDKPAEVKEPVEVVTEEKIITEEEAVAEAKETPTTQPAEVKEPVEVVAVEKVDAETKATPTTQPAEVKEPAEVVAIEKADADEAESSAKTVEITTPAEIETTKSEKPIEPVDVAEVETEQTEEPAEAIAVVEMELKESAEPEAVVQADKAGQTEPTPDVEETILGDEPVEERIDTTTTVQTASEQGWKKPIPITFRVDYTLATDYIFRGINFSEYRRSWGQMRNEGREKLNHQLTAGAELDLKQFGRVGYRAWFEFFAAQHYLTPEDSGKNLQRVEHTAYYGYNIKPLGLDLEAGFIWYMFPRMASGDGASTQEIYLRQTIDDSGLWRLLGFQNVTKPILNPYLYIAWDLDLARGGMYSEFGMSHDFELSELGMKNTPLLKDITITPTWSIGWDKNWLNKTSLDWMRSHPAGGLGNEGKGVAGNSSHLDFMNWGLELKFDLKSALNIPDKYCGEMYIKGFLNYSDAIAENFLNDEFYGGMSVGFTW